MNYISIVTKIIYIGNDPKVLIVRAEVRASLEAADQVKCDWNFGEEREIFRFIDGVSKNLSNDECEYLNTKSSRG